jgi:hypothetical protein
MKLAWTAAVMGWKGLGHLPGDGYVGLFIAPIPEGAVLHPILKIANKFKTTG